MESKQATIASLLKHREAIEDQIRALDPMALINYELKVISGSDDIPKFFTMDETLDMITTFNMSTSYTSSKEAQNESPKLYASKKECAREWVEKNFNQ